MRPDRGFALVTTLFALVLVSFLIAQTGALARRELAIATNIRAAAQADALAEGVVFESIFRVLAGQWRADGRPHLLRKLPVRVVVQIDDEAGRIDLNVAPLPLLQALLRICAADAATAAHVAAAIADWRSPNLPPLPDGAKAPQYRLAGRGYGPPNARFEHESELTLVLGMTPALYDCMRPHVTVFTGAIPVPGPADPVVMAAMREAYPAEAIAPFGETHRPRVIRVIVSVAAAARAQVSRSAVVALNPEGGTAPYRILATE